VPSAAEAQEVSRSVVVTGATGLVGRYLLPRLCAAGFDVRAVSRRPADEAESEAASSDGGRRVRWISLDLAQGELSLEPTACLFHTAPIWLLPRLLSPLADLGLRRLVAFSSTSRFTKRDSGSAKERDVARRLSQAEAVVEGLCEEHGIAWTLFRPTLIYGGGRDRNVSTIARVIRCFGVFPIAGAGRGRRQPVHADDLAAACLAVLDEPTTFGRGYEMPGGETLTYGEMVARIAAGLGRAVWTPRLPLPLLRALLRVASWLPGLGQLTPEMADRMNEDLVFDATAARRDFGYDPRPFGFPDGP
jgi:nucleoside-diphosphate-sugar epimerase